MKKMTCLLSLFLVLSMNCIASANFISNPGFEIYSAINPANFANWTEGGVVKVEPSIVYEGSASALLGVNGGYLYQDFLITEGSSLNYGAWFRIGATSLDSNWDQVQISLQIDSLPWTTIGGSVTNFISIANFVWNSDIHSYLSDWFMISNTLPVSSIPMAAHININAQNTDTGDNTKVFVDNAFAQSVPEPTTMLLLGFGLLGLAGIRKMP